MRYAALTWIYINSLIHLFYDLVIYLLMHYSFFNSLLLMEGGRLGVHGVNVANSVTMAHKTAHEVARVQLPVVEVITVLGNLKKPNPATQSDARVSTINLSLLLL